MDPDNARNLRLALAGVLILLVANGAVNLTLDAPHSWLTPHVLFELFSVVLAVGGAAFLWVGWWKTAQTVGAVRRSLEDRRTERDVWRESARRALEGLGEAVSLQFREWELTPAEREIALLLLKGYSHKRIAEMTGRRERTVRQHAVVVYQKSGLSGRAELAAFFLEDLLLPEDDRQHLNSIS